MKSLVLLAAAIDNLASAIRESSKPGGSVPARGLHTALRNTPDMGGRRKLRFGINAHDESETT